eukprot:651802_1
MSVSEDWLSRIVVNSLSSLFFTSSISMKPTKSDLFTAIRKGMARECREAATNRLNRNCAASTIFGLSAHPQRTPLRACCACTRQVPPACFRGPENRRNEAERTFSPRIQSAQIAEYFP